MFEERNDLCRKWKSAIKKLRETPDADRVTVDWEMNFTTESVSDMRRENLLSLNEVAAVLENENIALEKRKIVVA
jgi:hypothetical protein